MNDPPLHPPSDFPDLIAQLNTEIDRLQTVADAEDYLYGNPDWLSMTSTDQETVLDNWLTAFTADAKGPSGQIVAITPSEQSQLLALPLPGPVTQADATNFLARWNNTVTYYSEGIFNAADVPAGDSTNFIASDELQANLLAADSALLAMQSEGYTGIFDAVAAAANAAIDGLAASSSMGSQGGICATVQLQIDQQAVVARSAFSASLAVQNNMPTDPLSDVSAHIVVHDAKGNDVTNLFFIGQPSLTGLTATDGTGTLAAFQRHGQLDDHSHRGRGGQRNHHLLRERHVAVPGRRGNGHFGAAALDDRGLSVPQPQSAVLHPNAGLRRRSVHPDRRDSATLRPGPAGHQHRRGDAQNFTITSAQPKIVNNQKGLLINFNIIGSQVGNQPETPSLTLDMGKIASGQSVAADWLMTSSLDGTFTQYNATYQHSDALGGASTSLIDSVTVHNLVHLVQPDQPGNNGDQGFLVNDDHDPQNLPNILYLADGTTAPVNLAANPAVNAPVSPTHLNVTLTANMASGWGYIQMPDPGNGYQLVKVVRSDGTVIPVGSDVRTTHPVDAGTSDPSQDLLHLLDYNGTGTYTLYYLPPAPPPAATSLAPVSPNPASGPISSIDVTFSEQIDPTTFNPSDLSLTLNGGPNLIASGVTLTPVSGSTYAIGGLAGLTATSGVYQLTVLPGVVQDSAGELSTGSVSEKWANGNVGPYVVTVGPVSPNLRNTATDSVDVVFDEAINPATFDYHDLSLTLNGGSNLITSSVTVTPVQGSPNTYAIGGLSGLTAAAGNYQLDGPCDRHHRSLG